MSILSWLKTVSVGGHAGELAYQNPVDFAEGEENFRGLNMREALDAHIAWTHRLEARIKGHNDEPLDVRVVAADDRCALGEWIHNDARERFGGMTEYEDLKSIHAAFHLKAGEILEDVEDGKGGEERLRDIRRMSGDVQLALVRLYALDDS